MWFEFMSILFRRLEKFRFDFLFFAKSLHLTSERLRILLLIEIRICTIQFRLGIWIGIRLNSISIEHETVADLRKGENEQFFVSRTRVKILCFHLIVNVKLQHLLNNVKTQCEQKLLLLKYFNVHLVYYEADFFYFLRKILYKALR